MYKQSSLTDFSLDYNWQIRLMNEPRDIPETVQSSIWNWVRRRDQAKITEYN